MYFLLENINNISLYTKNAPINSSKNINYVTNYNEHSYFSNQKYCHLQNINLNNIFHQNLENGNNQYLKINGQVNKGDN